MDNITTLTQPGKKMRLFGGWYRHDKVYRIDPNGEGLDKCLGFIQVKRQHKRTTVTSHANGVAIIGSDPIWIAKQWEVANV